MRFAQATMKILLQVLLAVTLASVVKAEVVGEITIAGQTVYVWKQGRADSKHLYYPLLTLHLLQDIIMK